MILFRLFALIGALSLLLGPLAMDRAMAAPPASSHSQMTADGHCQPADEGKVDNAMAKPCCGAMCAAPAVVPDAMPGEQMFLRLSAIARSASFPREVLTELATPPPRLA